MTEGVHPRAGGNALDAGAGGRQGSIPARAGGNADSLQGSIPARAGETSSA